MALSPCQRYRRRVQAELALKNHEALSASPASLHLQLRELDSDVARVRSLGTIADRVEMKRDELLPKWLPTVEHYLESGIAHANPAFAWCVVWLFDVGNFDQALDWADIAIEQGQSTPENIKSTFATFVADTVMAWAETQASFGHSIEPYFSRTFINIRDKWRLHEEVNAKWYKFAGLLLLSDKSGKPVATEIDDVETLLQADALLAQAGAFDVKVGVKTHREKIAARIRALQKV